MAELDLLPAVRNASAETIIVADGTSCRQQSATAPAVSRCMSRGCWQRTWRVPSAATSRSAPEIFAIGFGQSSDALERRPEHLGHFPSKIAKSTPGGDMLKIRSGLARSALRSK